MHIPRVRIPDRRLFAGMAAGILIGVLGVGAVTAASPSPSGTAGTGAGATAAATAGARSGIRLAALRKAIGNNFRVEITATGKNGTHNILAVRGTLTVGDGSVAVTLPDGSTQAFAVDTATVVRDRGQTVALGNLADGEHVLVIGTKNADGSVTARLIRSVREARSQSTAPTPVPTP